MGFVCGHTSMISYASVVGSIFVCAFTVFAESGIYILLAFVSLMK